MWKMQNETKYNPQSKQNRGQTNIIIAVWDMVTSIVSESGQNHHFSTCYLAVILPNWATLLYWVRYKAADKVNQLHLCF